MKNIKFPGLNLEFNINNVAIDFGNVKVYWYAILIVSAFLIGILLAKKDDKKYNINFSDIFDMCIIMMPISIISARLYYCIFKFDDYKNNLLEIFNLKTGGLAIYGGIIGGVITIILFCKKRKINILDMLDYAAPFLALGQAIGRWGNFFNVEAYGEKTSNFLRMGILENGEYIEVHPTFFYESVCCLLIFVILYLLRNKRKFKGEITYLYLTLYAVIRAIIEGLRTDSLMLGCFRVSQILSIILFLIFGTLLILNIKNNKEKIK